jgi:dihydroorotate dehydrogenase
MYTLLRPYIFKTDPEQMHKAVVTFGSILSHSFFTRIFRHIYAYSHESLRLHVMGKDFHSPVGLGAGFDKNGELISFFPSLGFGFIEIGSVTAQPGKGNPRPRIFRLPTDRAIINRMGLNNDGADTIAQRLRKKACTIPLGINIAKTHNPEILGERAREDFCYTFRKIYHSADYIALNISCPNTSEGKTFEEPHALDELLSALKNIEKEFVRKKPLLIKISPDLSYPEIDMILDISERHKLDGYIISNTSLKRNGLMTKKEEISCIGKGGLSGAPIKKKSTDIIAYTHRQLKNSLIIGVGGIFSASDAYEKIKAGASLIQLYTGLIYCGPSLVKNINKGLEMLLKKDGFSSVKEAVGVQHLRL